MLVSVVQIWCVCRRCWKHDFQFPTLFLHDIFWKAYLVKLHFVALFYRSSERRQHWLVLQLWHQVLVCFWAAWQGSIWFHPASQSNHSYSSRNLASPYAYHAICTGSPILRTLIQAQKLNYPITFKLYATAMCLFCCGGIVIYTRFRIWWAP